MKSQNFKAFILNISGGNYLYRIYVGLTLACQSENGWPSEYIIRIYCIEFLRQHDGKLISHFPSPYRLISKIRLSRPKFSY